MKKYSLIGINGDAFSVLNYVLKCMKAEKATNEEKETYRQTAMSGDYNHLLATSLDMINKLNRN